MTAEFEYFKTEVEIDLGRLVDNEELLELKAIFFFAKCVGLKNQLKLELERAGIDYGI